MSSPVDYECLSAKNAVREASRWARPKSSAPGMRYTAHVDLDGANIAVGLSELKEWLEDRRIEPSTFRYRMKPDDVRLQIDFATLEDAAAFAEAFGGSVSGGTQGRSLRPRMTADGRGNRRGTTAGSDIYLTQRSDRASS